MPLIALFLLIALYKLTAFQSLLASLYALAGSPLGALPRPGIFAYKSPLFTADIADTHTTYMTLCVEAFW